MSIYPTDILTASPATVTGNPTPNRSWQWLRDGSPIAGKTNATYTVQWSDVGKNIQVTQTEANFLGEASATSTTGGIVLPWNPSTLLAGGTLGVWYDTTDLTTMYQDTAATIPVTSSNQLVARISPKAGTWSQLQQATVAAQPIVLLDSNSRYCVSFDSVDDGMVTSSNVQMTTTDEITVVAAIKFRSSTKSPGVFFVGGSTSGGSYGIFRGSIAQNNFNAINRGSVLPTTFPATAGIYSGAQNLVVSTMGKISTDYSEIFINGITAGLGSGDMGTGGWRTSTTGAIGKVFSQGLDGTVYGLFAINRLLTQAEHTRVVGYFTNIMGI